MRNAAQAFTMAKGVKALDPLAMGQDATYLPVELQANS